jgi:predicted nucleotidyltransferase
MNLDPIRNFLVEHLGATLTAAFVYGSVAAGRAGASSDLDCFVVTKCDLDDAQRLQIGSGFTRLQQRLGFRPDPAYPIELFSANTCRTVLADARLESLLSAAAARGVDKHVAESDEVEVLRALLDQRLVVRPAAVLDELTAQAWTLLHRATPEPAVVLQALGLAEPYRVRP